MSQASTGAQTGPVEILSEWEGSAIHEPGVLFDDQNAEHLGVGANLREFVGWLATAAAGGAIGNSTYEVIKTKARHILDALRQRYGKAKIEEIK